MGAREVHLLKKQGRGLSADPIHRLLHNTHRRIQDLCEIEVIEAQQSQVEGMRSPKSLAASRM